MPKGQMTLKSSLSLMVIALGLWAVLYSVFQPDLRSFSTERLATLSGCYAISGSRELLILKGNSLRSARSKFEVRGWREKDGDVLITDRPIQVVFAGSRAFVLEGGQVTKIPISYADPLSLLLFSSDHKEVVARKARCS